MTNPITVVDSLIASRDTKALEAGTLTSSGTLTGAEILPVSKTGLFQTTLSAIANFILTIFTIFIVSGTGAVARTILARLNDLPVSPVDFGADPTGTVDSTNALQLAGNFSNNLALPPGTYLYSTLNFSGAVQIKGAGKYATILKTSSLTGNTISIGTQGWSVRDVGFDATAYRTAGAHLFTNARYGSIVEVSFTKYYIGIDIDGSTGVEIERINALNGTPSATSAGGAILRLGNTTYTGGINIRGVIADMDNPAAQPSNGIILGYVDVVTIDGALIIHHGVDLNIAPKNGQFAALVEISNSHFDTAMGGMLARPAAGAFVTRINCVNTWFGEHTGHGVELDGTNGAITGISFTNCMKFANSLIGLNVHGANTNGVYASNSFAAANGGNGLQVTANAQNVVWDGGVLGATHGLAGNTSYGMGVDTAGITATLRNTNLEGNGTGRISDPGDLILTAGNTPYGWTGFTPVVGAMSGALTSASASGYYKKVNKTVHFRLDIVITTNGSAATAVTVNLPFTPVGADIFVGADRGSTGRMVQGVTNPGSATITVWFFDGTYPGANGAQLWLSGTYESQ